MSKYRSVQVSFWQDAFVLDLTPEEKYFYIYLMTNSKANQIGIYEL
ncbi:MAG: DNA replication protein DnaD, partial [Paenisporosarcina sp.]|nr:DNA replication protein DnaD [Paenisporosarcina sp.]